MSVDTERDLTGVAPSHRVEETLIIQRERLWWVAPTRRPFYTRGLTLHDPLQNKDLVPGDDYVVIHLDDDWSTRTQQELGHFLVILDDNVGAVLECTAQVLGGAPVDLAPSVDELREYVQTSDGRPPWGVFVKREIVDPDVEAILELSKKVTFQHVVEETEAIRRAILYGDTEHHDELMAFAVETRTRYYARILELLQTARSAIGQHVANKFAHQLTKDQIGLDQYPNYPVATRVVLEAGMSTQHLLTPAGFHVMLARYGIAPLQAHYAEEPAHNLTKAQIGLGFVENYPLANPTEAELGLKKDRYMVPSTTLSALQYQYSSKLWAHTQDADAHEVTPFQVGLGNYANYRVAGLEDFQDPESVTNAYLTPGGLYDLIKTQYWDDQLSHVYDEDNPHGLTKAQVGLGEVNNYSRDRYDELYARSGHHHTPTTLPFTEQELSDWKETAKWVLDSRVTQKVGGVLWREIDNVKQNKTVFPFPDTEANKVIQINTVLSANNRGTGMRESREGTVALMVTQIEPEADQGVEVARPSWLMTIPPLAECQVEVALDQVPESAWPILEAWVTSEDVEISTLYRGDVRAYVYRRLNDDNETHTFYYAQKSLREALFPEVDPAIAVPISFTLGYEQAVAGQLRHRYEIDNALFWLECQRLFPTLNYNQHEVHADLFFLTELPERLKGPDGIFFRKTGHYPYLRAGSTTKDDVGLGNLPDWSENTFRGKYAEKDHEHIGENWMTTSAMNATYLSKGALRSTLNDIRVRVYNYTTGNSIWNYGLRKNSFSNYTRMAPYPHPSDTRNDQYMETVWYVRKTDTSVVNAAMEWNEITNGKQTRSVPIIAANTGIWRLNASHYFKVDTDVYLTQDAHIEVDTGAPINNVDWVYEIYRDMLARGSNPYASMFPGTGYPTVLDPTGPNYWMNNKSYSSKSEMQADIAMTVINQAHQAGDKNAGSVYNGDTAYDNCVAFMNSYDPNWNWGPWEADVLYTITSDEEEAMQKAAAADLGGLNTSSSQYRNGRYFVQDPNAEPLKYEVRADRRKVRYDLFD